MNLYDVECQDSKLRLLILLLQAAKELEKLADQLLWKTNSTSLVQLVALKALRHKGQMTNTQLAEWTQTARHNITALVNRMQEDGKVIQQKAPDDKRQVRIRITPKGLQVLYKAEEVILATIDRLMEPYDHNGAMAAFLEDLRNQAHEARAPHKLYALVKAHR